MSTLLVLYPAGLCSDSSRVFDLGQVYPLALLGGAGGRVGEELHAIAFVKSGMHRGLALQAFAEESTRAPSLL